MPGPIPTSFPLFYIDPPYNLLGGLGWLILFGMVVFANWQYWEAGKNRLKARWVVIAALLVAAPVVAFILPIQVPLGDPLPVPGVPVEPHLPVLFVLAGNPIRPGGRVARTGMGMCRRGADRPGNRFCRHAPALYDA